MIYRQRETFVDDLLLRVVFPWFTALHATPLLRLAHFWIVPIEGVEAAPRLPAPPPELGVRLPGEAAHTEPMGRVAG